MNRPFSIALAAGLATLALAGHATAAQANPPTGAWAPTATLGSRPMGSIQVANMPVNARLRLSIALSMRDRAGADLLLRRETNPRDPMYGLAMTPAAFTARFNPTQAQVQAVIQYLSRSGMVNIAVEPNRLFVSATGSAGQISSAFHTSIGVFQQNGHLVYANTSPVLVPAQLRGTVLAVLGLNSANVMRAPRRYTMRPRILGRTGPNLGPNASPYALQTPPPCVNPGPVCAADSYTGQGFQLAYDAAGVTTGSKTSVAVFAEGDVTQVVKDLRTYEKSFGLPTVPYSVVQVGIHSPDVAGLDEWDLDTQTSSGIAQNLQHLYVYDTTSLSDSDTALEFNHFVTDDIAKAGNASFGICESFAFADGSMQADDQVFLQGAAQGQTVFSSTGDNGNGCPIIAATGLPGTGVPENSFPATSPYVVGVGGTTLLTNSPDGTYNSEVTWMGTGGGVSQHELSPYWQGGVVPILYREVGRTLPDVSMDADPNTGAVIYVNGAQAFIGGTSLSSPLAMGTWARLTSCHKKLGFAAPSFYAIYDTYEPCDPTSPACTPPVPAPGALTQLIGGFNDVLFGSNGGPYGTLPGYDLETGLGTFDIAKTNMVIK